MELKEKVKRIREKVKADLEEINRDYSTNKISEEEYNNFLSQKLDGRTREEWMNYCDEYIEKTGIKSVKDSEKLVKINDKLKKAKKVRKKLEKEHNEVLKDFNKGHIDEDDYNNFLSQRIDGKTRDGWMNYCDNYIDKSSELLKGQRLPIVDRNSLTALMFIMLLVSTVFVGYYGMDMYTGVKKYGQAIGIIPPEVEIRLLEFEYVKDLNLEFNEYGEYVLVIDEMELGDKLTSISITGSVDKNYDYFEINSVPLDSEGEEQESESKLIWNSYGTESASPSPSPSASPSVSPSVSPSPSPSVSPSPISTVSPSPSASPSVSPSVSPSPFAPPESIEITGFAVGESESINDEIILVAEGKVIKMDASGGGKKDVGDIFEFKVNNSFNWDVGVDKLCTKWEINNNLDSVFLCRGSEECCDLIGLESLGEWNDSLYLSYGRYGVGLDNTVSVQTIYANYSLSVENPYSDIVYSDIDILEASFYEARIEFENVCTDTCLLPGFDATSYKLKFIVSNANLKIDSIKYAIEKEVFVSKNAPSLIKDIENITIYKNGEFKVNLSSYFIDEDGDELIYSVYETENISSVITKEIVRLIPSINFTGKRFMYFTAFDGFYNITSNLFSIDVIDRPFRLDEVNISEELIEPLVVINKPVRWIKRVNVSGPVINLSVNISSDAFNVSVRDVVGDKVVDEDKLKVNDRGVVKNASKYKAEKRISQIEKIEVKLESKKADITNYVPIDTHELSSIASKLLELQNEKNKLTGYAVASSGKGLLTRFIEWLSGFEITGYAVAEDENESANVTSVIIGEIVSDIEVEYYTEGPVSEEENISRGKKVVISSDVHYEDILAYTYLDDVSKSSIKLYWIVNDSREVIKDVFYNDSNNNSLIDYIEWIVPSLSNQTYEVIIEITKAEYLDSNRSFIADVYSYVRAKDDDWTTIPSDDYIRITFAKALNNTRDITLYARSVDESASIEVYTEYGEELVVTFEDVSDEDWYKVLLTNLPSGESYGTFDLRASGDVEFDYIVDACPGTMTGDGGASPCEITSCDDLDRVRDSLSSNYILMKDIDCFEYSFEPIGYAESSDCTSEGGSPFTGTFDGQGHIINNLYMSSSNYGTGLFGHTVGATIRDVGLENADITGQYSAVGGLVGCASPNTYIERVYSTGSIYSSDSYAGGLIGVLADSYIYDSYSHADVYAMNGNAGGIVGYMAQDTCAGLVNTYATGDISGDQKIGALVGEAYSNCDISNSFGTGDISGNSQYGGLIGWYSSYTSLSENYWYDNPFSSYDDYCTGSESSGVSYEISTCQQLQNMQYDLSGSFVLVDNVDCYGFSFYPIGGDSSVFSGSFDGQGHKITELNVYSEYYASLFGYTSGAAIQNVGLKDVQISGTGYMGGLIGYAEETYVNDVYVTGDVSGTGINVGGLIGEISGPYDGQGMYIYNSYSTANVSGNTHVGGLVGGIQNPPGEIANSYATGNMYGNNDVGGLIGWNEGDIQITNSYFNSGLFGSCVGTGLSGDCNSVSSESELYGMSHPVYSGWDTNTWQENSGNYPTLRGEGEGVTVLGCYPESSESELYDMSHPVYSNWDSINNWVENLNGYPTLAWEDHIKFVAPTPANNTNTSNTNVEINISINGALKDLKWEWNGTNYTMYNESLVLMMDFNNIAELGEDSSSIADMSQYEHDGTVYGATFDSNGRYDGAYKFDGDLDGDSNSHIEVIGDLNLDELSVEFWFKPAINYNLGRVYTSLVYDENYEIFIENGKIIFSYGGKELASLTEGFIVGEWYHVVATYDGSEQTLYVNNGYEDSEIISGPFVVENNIGETTALFSNSGDIVLMGSCSIGTCADPGDDAFIVQNLVEDVVAYVDNSSNLCLENGDCVGGDDCSSPPEGSFIVKNMQGKIVSYIGINGELCLEGTLYTG